MEKQGNLLSIFNVFAQYIWFVRKKRNFEA